MSELQAVVASESLNTLFVGGVTDDCRLLAPNCVFPDAVYSQANVVMSIDLSTDMWGWAKQLRICYDSINC